MADATSGLNEADRAELVAYLSGELSPSEATRIATRLAREPALRREADRLVTSWELLDNLPQPVASAALTTRTMSRVHSLEEVPVESGPTTLVVVPSARRRGRIPTWLAAGSLAASVGLVGWAGYALAGRLWPPAEDRIVRDLSLAEHLEEYEAVGSWDFAQRLMTLPEREP